MDENKVSIVSRYGDDFTKKEYITNPAIGREEEIKRLCMILLTPDKSAILTGEPGIGKTAVVEGLAYQIQKNNVPDALKGYTIVKIDTQALIGTVMETGDSRILSLVEELKSIGKAILFVDEIHTLMNTGQNQDSALDFANMLKTGLGRGDVKLIGATTTAEYERYILRDKAFTRRFTKIEMFEPSKEHTIKIMMGTLPRIEKQTGVKMAYTPFIQEQIMDFIVELNRTYNRVYETAGRYPDVALSMLGEAFSEALFANEKEMTIHHVENAIKNSKALYDTVITKYLVEFKEKFKDIYAREANSQTKES